MLSSTDQDSAQEKASLFFPVHISTLREEIVPGFNIYLQQVQDFVLYCDSNTVLARDHVARLRSRNVDFLHVQKEDKELYLRYMVSKLEHVTGSPSITPQMRADLIYSLACVMVEDVIQKGPEAVELSREVAAQLSGFIWQEKTALNIFLNLMDSDYTLKTHSVNVCILATALACSLKLCDRKTLANAATGSLLHDVGKSRVPVDILNKNGPLNEDEFNVIKKHPQWSLEIAYSGTSLPAEAADVILNHHEKCDGSGYPRGLTGPQLDTFSKIACIADIFDAITTVRAYKDAAQGFSAFVMMQNEMNGKIDYELLRLFIQMIGRALAG